MSQVLALHNTKIPFEEETIHAKNYLFVPDEPARYFFEITSGRIKITSHHPTEQREVIKMVASKGDVIGLSTLLTKQHYDSYAFAAENTTYKRYKKGDLMRGLQNDAKFSMWVCRTMAARQDQLNKRLENMVFMDAKSRVIQCLIDLLESEGEHYGFELEMKNFLTHQEIGNLTATSRQTVTSVLNELRNEGLIKFNRRRILSKDTKKLKAYLEEA